MHVGLSKRNKKWKMKAFKKKIKRYTDNERMVFGKTAF